MCLFPPWFPSGYLLRSGISGSYGGRSSLYTVDMYLLSDIWFENIFSYLVGCLLLCLQYLLMNRILKFWYSPICLFCCVCLWCYWLVNLWQESQDYSMGEKSLQQMMLGQLDITCKKKKKNEIILLPHTIYKN